MGAFRDHGQLARLVLHFVHRLAPMIGCCCRSLAAAGARSVDVLGMVRSFFTSRVTWRGNEFDVDADGIMRRLS